MKKIDFFDQYKDPRWQKRRLEIMQRDEFMCQCCYDPENTLNVHHKYYIHNKKPWEYPDKLLTTVCQPCHDFIYNEETIRKRLAYLESKITKKFNKKLSREIDRILSLSE